MKKLLLAALLLPLSVSANNSSFIKSLEEQKFNFIYNNTRVMISEPNTKHLCQLISENKPSFIVVSWPQMTKIMCE